MDTHYNAEITIGPAPTRSIHLEETITLTNTTGAPLDRIVLRAPWNHWKDVFDLSELQVEGQDNTTNWRYGLNLELFGTATVANGNKITLI